jgi:hypothetical protein
MISSSALLSVLMVLLATCPAARAEEQSPEASQIEQLRAIGYIEAAPTVADPQKSGAQVLNRSRVLPGYRLYTSRRTCEAVLIDIEGEPVKTWSHEPCGAWVRAELTASGALLVIGKFTEAEAMRGGFNPKRRYLKKLSWQGELLFEEPIWPHHDVEQVAGGEIRLLTRMSRRDHSYGDFDLVDNAVVRLTPNGKVIDSLSLYDVLSDNDVGFVLQDVELPKDAKQDRKGRTLEFPPGLDLLHFNSLETMRRLAHVGRHPLYALGNVLLSARHQDAVFVVDLDRRRLVWAWGQGEISGQHDAQVLDDGNFLIFDNGLSSERSRVIELNPRTKEIVWRYDGGEAEAFFTEGRGGVQRLRNGNTLIAVSNRGMAFEVTPDGEVVWRFRNPDIDAKGHRGAIIRMIHYDTKLIDRLRTDGAPETRKHGG